MSRPLSTQQAQFDGERVWFFTEADSPKVGEIGRNPKVNLAYASKGKNVYISLTGKAKVNRGRAAIEALWSDAMKAFFPGGKDDPNLVLLEVAVHSIEYWEGPGTWLGKAIGFLVARVTRNEEVMGENRIVDLSGKRPRSKLPPSDKSGSGRKAAKKSAAKTAKKVAKKSAAAGTRAGKTATRGRAAGARRTAANSARAKAVRSG